jgi:hypothetical protein
LTSALSACATSAPVGDGCAWVDPPPPLTLCEPGEAVMVDENLIASCDAFTRTTGDWILGISEQGREVCGWTR